MDQPSDADGQLTPGRTETPDEVVECMRALLPAVGQLKKRWSTRVVTFALTTHSRAAVRALVEAGEYTVADAKFLVRDFRVGVMEGVRNAKQRKAANSAS